MCTALSLSEESMTYLNVQQDHRNTNSSEIDRDVIIRQWGGSVMLKETSNHSSTQAGVSYNNYNNYK